MSDIHEGNYYFLIYYAIDSGGQVRLVDHIWHLSKFCMLNFRRTSTGRGEQLLCAIFWGGHAGHLLRAARPVRPVRRGRAPVSHGVSALMCRGSPFHLGIVNDQYASHSDGTFVNSHYDHTPSQLLELAREQSAPVGPLACMVSIFIN